MSGREPSTRVLWFRRSRHQDVVGWWGGEGRGVEGVMAHVGEVQLAAGHVNGGTETAGRGGVVLVVVLLH